MAIFYWHYWRRQYEDVTIITIKMTVCTVYNQRRPLKEVEVIVLNDQAGIICFNIKHDYVPDM